MRLLQLLTAVWGSLRRREAPPALSDEAVVAFTLYPDASRRVRRH